MAMVKRRLVGFSGLIQIFGCARRWDEKSGVVSILGPILFILRLWRVFDNRTGVWCYLGSLPLLNITLESFTSHLGFFPPPIMADHKESEIAPGTRISESSVPEAHFPDRNPPEYVPTHPGELEVCRIHGSCQY
jgi:hypothetical protein